MAVGSGATDGLPLAEGPGPVVPPPEPHPVKTPAATVTCTATATVLGQSIGTLSASSKPIKVHLPYYSSTAILGPSGIYGNFFSSGGPPGTSGGATPPGFQLVNGVGTPDLFRTTQGNGLWE